MAEINSWSSNDAAGAIDSPLKLTDAGNRSNENGTLININYDGSYWNSSVSGASSFGLNFDRSHAITTNYSQGLDFSVRCIKDQQLYFLYLQTAHPKVGSLFLKCLITTKLNL